MSVRLCDKCYRDKDRKLGEMKEDSLAVSTVEIKLTYQSSAPTTGKQDLCYNHTKELMEFLDIG